MISGEIPDIRNQKKLLERYVQTGSVQCIKQNRNRLVEIKENELTVFLSAIEISFLSQNKPLHFKKRKHLLRAQKTKNLTEKKVFLDKPRYIHLFFVYAIVNLVLFDTIY